jgi:hypothetical protein
MDLHQVDPAAVPVHRAGQLRRAHVRRPGSRFVGDDHLVVPANQGADEQPPGVAVHQGRYRASARCPARPPARSLPRPRCRMSLLTESGPGPTR